MTLSAHRQASALPDLRIVSVSDLLFHEESDVERVARLIDRVSTDGVLRNPPIVARFDDDPRFLLLDGANRVAALRDLDVPHALVQVELLDDPGLVVSHWNHVVRDIESERMLTQAKKLTGARHEMGGIPLSGDPPEDFVCTIAVSEHEALHLFGAGGLEERVALLRRLTELYYAGSARMDRVNHADFGVVRRHHAHVGALVLFPDFSKAEIRSLAEAGRCLPSGVTRILVPRRVLGFNLQVAILKSRLSLEEKSLWLQETIKQRVADRRVRYYQEPTFHFDD